MQKLTSDQLMALSELGNHPLIAFVDISFHQSGYTHIMVSSQPNTNLATITYELIKIFPDMERGFPTVTHSDDGSSRRTYPISAGMGLYFNLLMNYTIEIAPLLQGAEELTLSNINTVRWSLEDIMRQEG